jgi:hypothetical protein
VGTFWEKLKFWSKAIVFGVAALYLLIVVTLNWELRIEGNLNLIFTKYQRPHVLTVLLVTALLSIVGWWLIRTVFKTLRQWQSLQDRSRTARLEREMSEMRAKAQMLQTRDTRDTPTPAPVAPATPPPSDAADL